MCAVGNRAYRRSAVRKSARLQTAPTRIVLFRKSARLETAPTGALLFRKSARLETAPTGVLPLLLEDNLRSLF